MATTYQYYRPGASLSGCPGTALTGGWYAYGSATPLTSSYQNPATGAAYTPQELAGLSGGGTTTTGTTGTPTVAAPSGYGEGGLYTSPFNQWLAETYPDVFASGNITPEQQAAYAKEFTAAANVGGWSTANNQLVRPTGSTAPVTAAPLPSLGDINVPAPKVTPAPPFTISPEQQAW